MSVSVCRDCREHFEYVPDPYIDDPIYCRECREKRAVVKRQKARERWKRNAEKRAKEQAAEDAELAAILDRVMVEAERRSVDVFNLKGEIMRMTDDDKWIGNRLVPALRRLGYTVKRWKGYSVVTGYRLKRD